MKLKIIAELQYKDPDSFHRRASSPGTLSVNSINDLYHKLPGSGRSTSKSKVTRRKKPS